MWPLNEHKNLHFDNEYIIHTKSKKIRQMTMGTMRICWSSCTNYMFHIPQEVGVLNIIFSVTTSNSMAQY